MIPDKYISAIVSIIPEPQIPVMPVDFVAFSNSGSSDHKSQPITLNLGSNVSLFMRTLSIAPGAAR